MVKFLKSLSIIATITMILVLLGGALVTKTGSGMGCGANWPICEGELSAELIIELSHRLVSGAAGIIVLLLSVLSWKFVGHIREVKFLSFVSIFFLVLQGLIGAAAVLWSQSDFVLAMHFGISLISFAAVFLLTLLIFEIDQKFDARSLIIEKGIRRHFYGLFIYILLVVYTGALVRHAHASLACPSWPFCDNRTPLALEFHFTQWIQMGHRLAAGLAFVWTLYLMVKIYRRYKHNRVMLWGWVTASLLMITQVALGAIVIFSMVNLTAALFHALIISIYFGVLSYFILLSSRSAKFES
ncbi:COX15/CtaA family protein [Sediminibacillus halophilus]|uniref:Heme A synthase n=1 Tax=Sediminibacillus halophilus TaxID=482461 RepID=A0A1G9MUU6_9BACI|nr:heme A synthase [Sediminibacillus halophilus]SDL78066.1 cytochrome c oxidase assembly protein subunit 15 [Sediminibacillus halophilus]